MDIKYRVRFNIYLWSLSLKSQRVGFSCFFTSFPSHICFVSVWFYFKYCIIIKLISNITYYMNRIQSQLCTFRKQSIFSGSSNKLSGKKWCRKKLVLKFMARTFFFFLEKNQTNFCVLYRNSVETLNNFPWRSII